MFSQSRFPVFLALSWESRRLKEDYFCFLLMFEIHEYSFVESVETTGITATTLVVGHHRRCFCCLAFTF